ncbi:uncharacterized protein LOC106086273 isoform X2 [Stomoxys calcitrans]|uniref:Uncharacterized protein n=1 Tax=Stomoxys calcitrans TaxID=35570 RepID=A0A1I8Q8D3_STOCA|nr:uncharacterized protein LOC106086273 isoform X2 [Stomoxys calcitrans]
MRAHFATDVPASPDADGNDLVDSSQAQTAPSHDADEGKRHSDTQEKLKSRIVEFKSDSSKMAVVGEFIDEVLEKAEEEANKQQNTDGNKTLQQNKNKSQKQNFKNGKVVNKARGFVVRLFESICNCANNAAAAPVSRFKFRSGKRASTSTDVTETNGKADINKKEEKTKKSVSVKEKKSEKIKFEDEKMNAEQQPQEAIELQ